MTCALGVLAGASLARAEAPPDPAPSAGPPLCGVLVLPSGGVDIAVARELTNQLVAAFSRERELTLVDAERLARSQRLKPRFPPVEQVEAIDKAIAARRLFRARRALRALIGKMRARLSSVRKRTLAELSAKLALLDFRLNAKRRARQQIEALLVWRPRFAAHKLSDEAGWAKLVAAARAAVASRPRGSVRVTSVPPGAVTFLDGRRLGPTPTVAANVVVGQHLVTVRRGGYKRVVLPITVSAGGAATPTFSVRLERDPAGSPLATLTKHLGDSLGIDDLAEARTIGERLSLSLGLFVAAKPAAAGGTKLALSAHLYDLNSGRRKASATLTVDQPFSAANLAPIAVWRAAGGPLSTAPRRAPSRRGNDTASPIYKRWWFWAAIVGVAAAGVVVPVVLTRGDRDQAPGELLRVSW
ncbi:MAG: PEGA domain-containing protein [Myxococcales bacterium]|nr:PEGA domain-containing protein [Myxococcales bacterium]